MEPDADLVKMLLDMQEGRTPLTPENTTVLPADEFDRFVGMLDEPDRDNPKLRALLRGLSLFRRS